MEKLDLRKQWKHLYAPPAKKVAVVEVPAFNFAMVDGQIEAGQTPGTSPGFQGAMMALYGVSYTLKFASKLREQDPIDYPVMALEGLWWVDSGEFDLAHPEGWRWRAMMMQPEHITPEMFREAVAKARQKREGPAFDRLHLERFHEGLAVQTMHIGPYAEEPATIARMQAYAAENGYVLRGKHHEIYLSDPRRTSPEKLRTVLRHPVEKT